MQKLSGLDTVFLHAETPRTPMNVIATIVLEAGAVDTLEQATPEKNVHTTVLARLRERVAFMPPFRRKLVETPFGLDQPGWIEDARFAIEDHVLHTVVAGAGTPEDLERLVARIAERPLDRSRPLWELWVIEGLDDGGVALVTKAHHAALDGVSGASLLLHLFDRPEAEGAEPHTGALSDPWRGEEEPSPAALVSEAASRVGERTRTLADAARVAGGGIARILRSRIEDAAPVRDAAQPFTAPPTPFNRAISPRRSVAYASTPLDRVGSIREAFGGSINDVVLAACTGALRDWLIDRNELPETPLVASIPVSTRGAEDEAGGNHISAMLADLPVHIDDPAHRYFEVCRAGRRAKRFHSLLGKQTVAAFAELSPGPLVAGALRLYSRWGLADLHRPLQNLVISNVPGPPQPLSFAGAAVRALHPHGPLMDGAGLNITVMSYAGSLDVGVLACREAIPDPGTLARGVAAEFEALAKRAETELSDRGTVRLRIAS